jgi:TonB family protein
MTRATFTIAVVFLCGNATATPHVTLTPEQAAKLTIYKRQPEYPRLARAYRMTGNGLFQLHVQGQTGLVKDVQIERSTGWSILDSSAKRALKQWRFKPGGLPSLKLGTPQRDNPSGDFLIHMPIRFILGTQGR